MIVVAESRRGRIEDNPKNVAKSIKNYIEWSCRKA